MIEELCAPYADVIDIRIDHLPSKAEVAGWDSVKFASAIRHIPNNQDYNPDMRQLLHVHTSLQHIRWTITSGCWINMKARFLHQYMKTSITGISAGYSI